MQSPEAAAPAVNVNGANKVRLVMADDTKLWVLDNPFFFAGGMVCNSNKQKQT
jgi:hypothetical protein